MGRCSPSHRAVEQAVITMLGDGLGEHPDESDRDRNDEDEQRSMVHERKVWR